MSKLLFIGDSNVFQNVRPAILSEKIGLPVTVIQCTKEFGFTTQIPLMQTDRPRYIVLSVLSNFFCDLGEEIFEEGVEALLQRFTTVINYLNDSTVLVLPPILRYSPTWYRDRYPAMLLGLQEAIAGTGPHVLLAPEFRVVEGDLESDGVHMTRPTGTRFLDHIVSVIHDVLKSNPLTPGVLMKSSVETTASSAIVPAIPSTSTGVASPQTTPSATTDDIMRYLTNSVMPQIRVGAQASAEVRYIYIIIIFSEIYLALNLYDCRKGVQSPFEFELLFLCLVQTMLLHF